MKHYENRVFFLREFTKELILNSQPQIKSLEVLKEKKEERLKEATPAYIPIHIPVLEERPPQPPYSYAKPLTETIPLTETVTKIEESQPKIAPLQKPQAIQKQQTTKIYPSLIPAPQPRYQIKPILPAKFKPSIKSEGVSVMKDVTKEILPSAENLPVNFDLGKINFLIRDPRVTLIECPGPGKLVTAKTLGQTSITKLSLTEEEILSIIKKFSEKARIPILPGLFKAAVGNLVITAVVSDLAGSRFVITKITPSFILEQQSK